MAMARISDLHVLAGAVDQLSTLESPTEDLRKFADNVTLGRIFANEELRFLEMRTRLANAVSQGQE